MISPHQFGPMLRDLILASTSGSGYSMIGMPRPATSLSRCQPRVTRRFLVADERRIELALVERAVDDDGGSKSSATMYWASVGLQRMWRSAGRVEHFGIEQADHVAKVEIAIGELGHVLAAHVAEIAFVAFGHGEEALVGRR